MIREYVNQFTICICMRAYGRVNMEVRAVVLANLQVEPNFDKVCLLDSRICCTFH